jgi:four helix bundle protein
VAASDRDLIAWKKAMALAARVYDVTDRFPARERFGLTAQVQRAAVSVPSNIAEGQARYSRPEFRFLRNARGSLAEVDTQLLLARHRKYLSRAEADSLLRDVDELGRIISGLLDSLNQPGSQ